MNCIRFPSYCNENVNPLKVIYSSCGKIVKNICLASILTTSTFGCSGNSNIQSQNVLQSTSKYTGRVSINQRKKISPGNESFYNMTNNYQVTFYNNIRNEINGGGVIIMDKLNQNLKLLESFVQLPENWNGYGAKGFTAPLVSLAKEILNSLEVQPDVFPTGRESIQFEYEKCNGEYLEFEIFNKSDIQVFIVKENGDEYEDLVEVNDVNRWVGRFYGRV